MRFAALMVAVFGVVVSAQAPDLLDLRQSSMGGIGTITTGIHTVTQAGRSSTAKLEPIPLRLSLDWLDLSTYRDGDRFEFHVTLQNIGNSPVRVPWEPNPHMVVASATAPAMLEALLTVDIESPKGLLSVVVGELYGSSVSDQTSKILPPGAAAEIVASGAWQFLGYSSNDLIRVGLAPTVHVVARLRFITPIDQHMYRPLVSANTLPIVLKRLSER